MKFKILDVEVKNWQGKEFKVVKLQGEAGETYGDNGEVTIWKSTYNSQQYNTIIEDAEIEAELTQSKNGKGFNLSFQRKKKERDYDAEEKRRTARINWWASMNNSVQLLNSMDPKDWKDEEIQAFIQRWGAWFLKKCHDYEVNIK